MKKRLNIKVIGKVQGVFFRAETQKEAYRLGILGYVKNMEDESVDIVAEGEEESLKEFINWVKQGPELAKVEKTEEKFQEATGEFNDFKVE